MSEKAIADALGQVARELYGLRREVGNVAYELRRRRETEERIARERALDVERDITTEARS